MERSSISSASLSLGQVADTNWHVEAVGDINVDGKVDLLWRHQKTGQVSVWLMNGTTATWMGPLGLGTVSDTSWRIAGVADFNADGKADVLWGSRPRPATSRCGT